MIKQFIAYDKALKNRGLQKSFFDSGPNSPSMNLPSVLFGPQEVFMQQLAGINGLKVGA